MRQAQRHYSVEEYLSIEAMSNIRHEYYGGEIFAMSGGSRNHNEVAQNIANMFRVALRNHGCRTYLADVRLRTPGGLYTYPDVMVVCGGEVLTGENPETLTNPVVLIEVLSASTADYDRGEKFDLYRAIPTLTDLLLVDQYAVDVELRWLSGSEWRSQRKTGLGEEVRLTGLDLTLPLVKIYEGVGL